MVVNNWNKQRCKIGYNDISVWLSTNHLLNKILLYLQNLDKMVKKDEVMMTIYTNNYIFSQEYIGSSWQNSK